jgi:PAS domain S-box-containing protein
MKYSPFYVFFLDEINRPIRLSDNFSKLIDWSPEEIVGKNLDEIFPEELTKILIADNPKMLNEGVSITGEFIYNDRKYSIIKFPILFEEIPQLISGFIIDITEQNEAVSAMQETRDRYQALFNRSLDYVYIHDLNGVIIDVNQPFLSKLGYEKDEIINKNISSFLFDDQNLQTMLRDIENIKKDGYLRKASEYKLKGKNDLLIDVETNASLIYSEGKPVAIQGIARDITDRIKAVGC